MVYREQRRQTDRGYTPWLHNITLTSTICYVNIVIIIVLLSQVNTAGFLTLLIIIAFLCLWKS